LIGRQLWKEELRTGTVDVGRFVLRRGLRIWPLYFFIAMLSPALDAKWSYKWSDWTLLSNYFIGRVDGGWSLSTEEQFYILAPLLLLIGARHLRTRGRFVALISALVAVSGVRWWTAHRLIAAGRTVAQVKTAMYTPFHLHNEGLIVGLMLALLSVTHPAVLNGTSNIRKRIYWVAGMTCGVALLLRAIDGTVFPFLSLALIYGSIAATLLSIGSERLHLLRSRLFYRVSRLSYGMYLNHFAVLRWIAPSIARLAKAAVGQSVFALVLTLSGVIAISAAFAAATFVLIEHPFLALRDRLLYLRPIGAEARSRQRVAAVPVAMFALTQLDSAPSGFEAKGRD
jgi:peptidoglycan/LPS O-acetylase OafA/YrhL